MPYVWYPLARRTCLHLQWRCKLIDPRMDTDTRVSTSSLSTQQIVSSAAASNHRRIEGRSTPYVESTSPYFVVDRDHRNRKYSPSIV